VPSSAATASEHVTKTRRPFVIPNDLVSIFRFCCFQGAKKTRPPDSVVDNSPGPIGLPADGEEIATPELFEDNILTPHAIRPAIEARRPTLATFDYVRDADRRHLRSGPREARNSGLQCRNARSHAGLFRAYPQLRESGASPFAMEPGTFPAPTDRTEIASPVVTQSNTAFRPRLFLEMTSN
jgi:hypothetical protein